MKVPYVNLRMHFPDTDSVERDELYRWIGYPQKINDPNFYNTCAIRVSLALLGAGYPNPGQWPVVAGKYKGRAIETQQRRLSAWLTRHVGQPEKFKGGQSAERAIGERRAASGAASSRSSASTATPGHKDTLPSSRRIGGVGIYAVRTRSTGRRLAATGHRARCGSGRWRRRLSGNYGVPSLK